MLVTIAHIFLASRLTDTKIRLCCNNATKECHTYSAQDRDRKTPGTRITCTEGEREREVRPHLHKSACMCVFVKDIRFAIPASGDAKSSYEIARLRLSEEAVLVDHVPAESIRRNMPICVGTSVGRRTRGADQRHETSHFSQHCPRKCATQR